MRTRDDTPRGQASAPGSPGTSSADPAKLHNYSVDGLDMIDDLKPKANAAVDALRALAARGYPHRLGDTHTRLYDLVGDWRHLDEFVGDVSDGFLRAGGGDGRVVTVGDSRLHRLGRIGYADRDEAITAARNAAAELRRLLRSGADPETIQNFIGMVRRGQYDPAFAVEFSHKVSPGGYVKAVSLIRKAYEPDRVPAAGIAAVQTLGTTLTTALDTLRNTPAGERHDPDNQYLPDDQRLSSSFVRGLTSGYQLAGDELGPGHRGETADLSVLLRFTDPPTNVAVDIANNRMTPLLGGSYVDYPSERHGSRNPWGQYGDPVVNYATMLNRNEDAAAHYLSGTSSGGRDNIALVLDHDGSSDSGLSLANLVQTGVTHDVLGDTVLNSAIDAIGDPHHGIQPIRNPYMHDALAAGVAENMDLIDRRINSGPMQVGEGASPGLRNTVIFLSEVGSDASAGNRIREATLAYVTTEASGPSAGAILQVTMLAEENAREQAFQTTQRSVGTWGAVIDGATGAPGAVIGIASKGTAGVTPGEWIAEQAFEHGASYNTAAHESKINDLHRRLLHDVASLERQGLTGVGAAAYQAEHALESDQTYTSYTPRSDR
ncbi:MAG: hypothetical protein ACRD2C_05160 [Acidimicrobiales bacterium]